MPESQSTINDHLIPRGSIIQENEGFLEIPRYMNESPNLTKLQLPSHPVIDLAAKRMSTSVI